MKPGTEGSKLPSSLASMRAKKVSTESAAMRASLKSGSKIIVANWERTSTWVLASPSGAAIIKKMRAGLPSKESKLIPSGTVMAAKPALATPADLACGVAMPSPRPVEPDSSRVNTAARYSSLLAKLPPRSMRSAKRRMADGLSVGLAPSWMDWALSKSLIFIVFAILYIRSRTRSSSGG